jgi:hypothetical protein
MTTPRRLHRAAALARGVVAASAVLVLAACAGIPREGPVVPGRPAGKDPSEGMYQLIQDGPQSGATPEQSVTDFLRAATGFRDDHRVARSFLAPSRRLAWRPDASVAVYPGQSPPTPVLVDQTGTSATDAPATPSATASPQTLPSEQSSPLAADPGRDRDLAGRATVRVNVPVLATIDGDGRYWPASPGARREVTYGLVRVDGEWRIDAVPDGILISTTDFGVTFQDYPVYFADSGRRYLVPDVHWFPGNNSAAVPTALVRALLAGPAPWLAPGVRTGVPEGTQMEVNAVVVSGNVATVDLNDRARSAEPDERQLLALQLRETLAGFASTVKITVRGADFDVPTGGWSVDTPGESSAGPRVDPSVDSRPVVMNSKGRLARVEGQQRLVPVTGVDGLAVPGASRPAMSSDGTAYAVLGPQRGQLLLQLPGTSEASVVVTGRNLTAPSFDPSGWVWVSPEQNNGRLYAGRIDTPASEVAAPWLAGFLVSSARVSRDGARLLVAARKAGTPSAFLFVAGIARAEDGKPEAVTEPLSLVPDLTSAVDAAWVDEDQVVVLGRRSGTLTVEQRQEQPWIVRIGGSIEPTTPAPGATSITAGNGALTLVAGNAQGLMTRAGQKWEVTPGGYWPAFPG